MPRRRQRPDARPILVDVFSGCGGTSRGFAQAGFDVRAALDNDRDAAETFAANFPTATVICRDIRELEPEALLATIRRGRGGRPVVVSACAPCQPFTKHTRSRRKNDDRVDLLSELLRFVGVLRPDVIFVENVMGLARLAADLGPFHGFVRSLRARGYAVSYRSVRSCDFGVPQVRERLVLLASLHGSIGFPSPTHGPGRRSGYATVRDAIGHLPRLRAGDWHPRVDLHRAARLSELNLQRIRATPEGGGRDAWPKRLVLACHRGRDIYTDAYGRLAWNSPAPALTTRCNSYSNGRYGHPSQDRSISLREAACLQTFPEDFTFQGNQGSVARQIGNAVPVLLARAFGRVIVRHLNGTRRRGGAHSP